MVNGTFKTNKLSLVLLVIIGVIATNKNFPTTYNFTKSKAIILFNFLFNSFRYFIFSNDIAEPRVVLTNQAAGLIAVMPVSMPNCFLQHYSWHVSQNIAKRLTEKRYLIDKYKKIINYV